MRVLIAPQELKGTLTAAEAARAIARGLRAADREVQVDLAPIADGGPGTVDALLEAKGGELRRAEVTGPRGGYLQAAWALLPERTAVVETAAASGLSLLSEDERDALHATSYGTGELLRAALDAGARRILVGLGGSASVDGGMGMAAALGVRFLRKDGAPVALDGWGLRQLARIDLSGRDPRIAGCELVGLCDVQLPLTGETGAARLFGPQKGASPSECFDLDQGLAHLAAIAQRDLGVSLADAPGAGAAGGMGFGLSAFLGGQLTPGFPVIAEALELDERLAAVELVVTAEGRLDAQSSHGKGTGRIARLARAAGKQVVILAGQVTTDAPRALFDRVIEVGGSPRSIAEAERLLARAARTVLGAPPRGWTRRRQSH